MMEIEGSAVRYLKGFLIHFLLCLILYLLMVLFIDPYGFGSEALRFQNFNVKKIEDPFMDGRVARLGVLVQQPKTVLLGSSRVVLGYDINRFKDTELWPAYNASTYNSSLKHRLKTLEYIIQTDLRLKNVFIEIFPTDILHPKHFWYLVPVNPDKKAMLKEFIPIFFSLASFKDNFAILKKNLFSKKATSAKNTQPSQLSLKLMPYSATQFYKLFPPEALVNNEWQSTVKEIYSVCEKHHLNCHFFISPMNARILYGYYRTQQWKAIEQFKIHMSQYSIYDFLWLNPYTAEADNSNTVYWEDCLHHSQEVGNKILDSLAGKYAGQSESFFTQLNKDNVSQQLRALKKQMEIFIAQNPALPLTYSIIRENLEDTLKSSKIIDRDQQKTIEINGRHWQVKQSNDKDQSKPFKGGKIIVNDYSFKNKTGMIVGLAANLSNKMTAERVAIVCEDEVIAWARPSIHDIEGQAVLNHLEQDGFFFNYSIPAKFLKPGKPLQIYSLFADGTALKIQDITVVK